MLPKTLQFADPNHLSLYSIFKKALTPNPSNKGRLCILLTKKLTSRITNYEKIKN